jgi:phage shock protein C
MPHSRPLILREDTFFGVCEALGEDFGINPLFLRLVFAVALLWDPAIVIGTYFALGIVVLISRLAFPRPRVQAASSKTQERVRVEPVLAQAA